MKFRHFSVQYLGIGLINKIIRAPKLPGTLKVLAYHNIDNQNQDNFYKQIKYIHKNYQIVNPQLLDNFTFNGPREKQKILLTFDDGFKSHATIVQKVLDSLNIKALFFIPTEFIGIEQLEAEKKFISQRLYNNRLAPNQISNQYRAMSWADISNLIKQGHLVGAHTMNHRNLAMIQDKNEFKKEIIKGGQVLENKLGGEISHFALPFGNINTFNQAILKTISSKYKFCHTTIRGLNYLSSQTFLINRDPISPSDPIIYLDFIINNGLSFLYRHKLNQYKNLL